MTSADGKRLVVVTGTGTDIGKTYVTAALARALGARARKPVQSFDPTDESTLDSVAVLATVISGALVYERPRAGDWEHACP